MIEHSDDKILTAFELYEQGDVEKFGALLEEDRSLLTLPLYLGSWLHHAAFDGKNDFCSLLLEKGMAVDTCLPERGYLTPLVMASFFGHLETVKLLCEHEANIDGHPRGEKTPVMAAASEGKEEVLAYLLQHNPDLERLDRKNRTALDLATKNNHQNCIDLLKKHAAQHALGPALKFPFWSFPSFLYEAAWQILNPKFTVYDQNIPVEILTAWTNTSNSFKVIFTNAVSKMYKAQKAFFLYLPAFWPLNKALLRQNDPYSFPVQVLSRIITFWLTGHTVEDGFLLTKEDDLGRDLAWPEDLDGLLALDQKEDAPKAVVEEEQEKNFSALALIPVMKPWSGWPHSEEWRSFIEEYRKKKYSQLPLP